MGKSKAEKIALKYGVDENNLKLHYICPNCQWDIGLLYKRCPKCNNKRPKEAYSLALRMRDDEINRRNPQLNEEVYVDRTAQLGPTPKQACYATIDVEEANKRIYASEDLAKLGIPKFYSQDEYGRTFEMPVSYKPLPYAGPVPVAKPSVVVQTEKISVPIDINLKQ
ncbi:MAG: hypothetical protein K5765_03175 [Clostridia bacterium]|nr:hypothetical protein [Clostridia bacterium]